MNRPTPEERKANHDDEARDSEFLGLWRSGKDVIPSEGCDVGYLYWGGARSIGEIAICNGRNSYGEVRFEGLRNKFGVDYLFEEIHCDDNPNLGTYAPYVKWKQSPAFETDTDKMSWILDAYAEVISSRIDWMMGMPSHLKQAPSYEPILEMQVAHLEGLIRLQLDGFSDKRDPTFREIMEARRKAE